MLIGKPFGQIFSHHWQSCGTFVERCRRVLATHWKKLLGGILMALSKPVFRIRIRMDPHSICLLDPDPAADKISSKSQKIHII
jgi:hypothetical protein